jgi:hypothetical protein
VSDKPAHIGILSQTETGLAVAAKPVRRIVNTIFWELAVLVSGRLVEFLDTQCLTIAVVGNCGILPTRFS